MRIVASAPGKLVLLGEYAVLEGAPALVLAVDRRATATLTPAPGPAWEIESPTIGLRARLRFEQGAATWVGTVPPRLAWVAATLERVPGGARLPACRVELESDRFYLGHRGARHKLGLGSSAALAVALLGALHAHAGLAPPALVDCIAAHRVIQRGRGSGIDIAAALTGGLSRFRLDRDRAVVEPAKLPNGLRWCCAYTGRPASTSTMLAGVAAWRKRDPVSFGRYERELAARARRGVAAVGAGTAAAFLDACRDYAGALARFGRAAGVDIVSREHRALGAIAAECGCAYKSCGAGGGDVGVTLAVEDERLREFQRRAVAAGFPMVECTVDPQGLLVATCA